MKIRQVILTRSDARGAELGVLLWPLAELDPQLVLVFGDVGFFRTDALADTVASLFPEAVRAGCSTAGEISGAGADERTCVVTAVQFDHGSIKGASTELASIDASLAGGAALAAQLAGPGLKGVLLFGQGSEVDGSALLRGITRRLGDVAVAGGLAGDDGSIRHTYTLDNAGVSDRRIVGVGLYGERMAIGRGSFGGWEAFGPTQRVTGSRGNVLAELDGESALGVYKRYLGEYAKDLPASGPLFPFLMLADDHDERGLIRGILGVDESRGTLTLAGEIDPGGYLMLMHASPDKLIDGAEVAALDTARGEDSDGESLAMLVSGAGRKRVMGARVDEEVEAVAAVLGTDAVLAGFYSYGEFGPVAAAPGCRLHNQTMTVMRIGETPSSGRRVRPSSARSTPTSVSRIRRPRG